MIKGRFNADGQATVSGLLSFSLLRRGERPEIAIEFVVDTGANCTTIVASDFEPYGYAEFSQDEKRGGGYGGDGLYYKKVPIERLEIKLSTVGYGKVYITEVDVLRPNLDIEGMPSVIGRDLIDQYRLIIDKTANMVQLNVPIGPTP